MDPSTPGCRLNRPTGPIHNKKSHRKGLAMSEKWGISRVGKLELEVGETLQEAIVRLQILPLPPLAWTDCFLQTARGHGVTIIGTETHPDKIEALARPAEVEDVLAKIDSAIENANEYVEKVVLPRRQADRDVQSAEADERQKLQAELDQLAGKLSKPEFAEDGVPSEPHLFRQAAGEGVGPYGSTAHPRVHRGQLGNPNPTRRCDLTQGLAKPAALKTFWPASPVTRRRICGPIRGSSLASGRRSDRC